MPLENTTSWDDSAGEVKFTIEGKEFSFDALFQRRPGMKFSHKLREFIRS